MLVSLIPAAAAAGFERTQTWSDDLFTDVETEKWFYETVKTAYELDLMSGTGDGKFNPTGEISLAETIAIAARIHAINATGQDDFVQGSPWYQVYVDYALANGILSEQLSDYTKKANRLEFAHILAKALPAQELPAINTVEDGAIPDLKQDEDVYMLYRAGILTGTDTNGTFKADATITRSEVAAIAARMADPTLRMSVTLTNGSQSGTFVPDYNVPSYDEPTVDVPTGGESGVLDETNALTVPFDVAYPDLFASGEVNYSGEQILIKVASAPTGEQQGALSDAGVTGLEHIMDTTDAKWYKAYVSGDVNTVMSAVRALSFVQVAEYDFTYESDASIIECEPSAMDEFKGNDHVYDQWYLRAGGIKDSWDHLKYPHKRPHYDEDKGHAGVEEDTEETAGTEAGQGILVAVIDTGVDYTHEDLKGNIFVNDNEIPDNGIDDDGNGYVDDYYGWNAVAGNGSAMDDQGHGTHVAGIIAAANNEMGIVGIAYNATILPIKAGMASGYFNSSDIAEAITYASEMGADVINMSFGGVASTTLVADALEAAYTKSVLVAAAGNNGYPNEVTDYYMYPMPTYPAAYSYVLGVMSVDQSGVESSFTNWDARSFNSVEYEVYAPGEAMISTIPGNSYATWSGTSMAAPVVSAMAALLRSEFRDNNTYPTKFIYGQICGTSDVTAICNNPIKHTVNGVPHQTAQIVNLYNALTIMPNPDVGMTDYTVFDTVGLNGNMKNNGDGVIDAGETIALGFTLRNKWGKSKDTTITVTTNDPYVTFITPSVNIGEVGTYSTNDCGKVIVNDAFVGWENPVYITVREDCPNDYIFTLNVTVTCQNGLDSTDTVTYSSNGSIDLDVRNGVVLPNLIETDMVLTKDNFYVIPNATLIKEGATVTVEAGTQIQFWSDDPNDAYADTAITYLNVEGTLICKGTAEDPIKMFPSERMGQYRVEINEKNNGTVKLFYTDIVNPYLTGITYAEGCEFSQNYRAKKILYRYLDNGTIRTSESSAEITITYAKECAFYKLGTEYYWYPYITSGHYYGCIFVDSQVSLMGTYENCLFYGNNNYLGENNGAASNITLSVPSGWGSNTAHFATNTVTGTTYIRVYTDCQKNGIDMMRRFAQILGGDLVCINSEAELAFIRSELTGSGNDHVIGLVRDPADGSIMWVDGTTPQAFVDYAVEGNGLYGTYNIYSNTFTAGVETHSWEYVILEIPGIHVEEIFLNRYAVTLDTAGAAYQIGATAAPSDVANALLIYQSMDESVATVSSTGLVTPVGVGSTEIRVYSPDMYVYNTLNVTVTEAVELKAIDLGEDFRLGLGESKQLDAVLTPADSSKQYLVYESSDPAVVSVNVGGVVTAMGVGAAVITATNPESGIFDTITVEGIVPVTGITAEEPLFATDLDTVETVDVLGVTVTPANATYQKLVWESSNPEILSVDENGNLVKSALGTATLRATVEGSDRYTEVTVALTDMDTAVTVVEMHRVRYNSCDYEFALLSDGTLWYWGTNTPVPVQLPVTNVKQFAVGYCSEVQFMIVDNTDTLNVYTASISKVADWTLDNSYINGNPVKNVVAVAADGYNASGAFAYALADGTVWGWGYNAYGRLGTGNTDSVSTARQIPVEADIIDIAFDHWTLAVLAEDGTVWYSGSSGEHEIHVPTLTNNTGVVGLHQFEQGGGLILLEYTNQIQRDLWGDQTEKLGTKMLKDGNISSTWYIGEDGYVYVQGGNSYGYLGTGNSDYVNQYVKMEKVCNVSDIFVLEYTTYIQTTDGRFYGVGKNDAYQIPNLTSGSQYIPTRIFFGLDVETSVPALENETANIVEGVLNTTAVVLDFDQAVISGSYYGGITLTDGSGNLMGIRRTFHLDKVLIAPAGGFTVGEEYILTIPAGAFANKFGVAAEAVALTFTAGEGAVVSADNGSVSSGSSGSDVVETVINYTQVDPEATGRTYWTQETLNARWEEYVQTGVNPLFYHNAIINRLNDDDVTKWLRLQGASADVHTVLSVTGNWWGTTNEFLIDKQILDFDDYQTLADLNVGEYLTSAPADVWPFVVDAWLENSSGQRVDTIGNETVTFCVQFNRAMNTAIPLDVRFGSTYPYADYEVEGSWVSSTLWKGTTTLTTLIEAGYQYWSVDNGCAADNAGLKLYKDWGRFPFEIDTSDALAMILQGVAGDEGVALGWYQDDYAENTLAGYNVYRADKDEDGYYQKLNPSVIPVGTKEFFDDTVEPGKVYYYIFTAVLTDFSESEPSGKIRIVSKDTMAPTLYHTPVYSAYENRNVVISATASDNVGLSAVTLYYRIGGTTEWTEVEMTKLNDKYSAYISGNVTADALGKNIEYYVTAFDGVSTVSRGSAAEPYTIVVQADPGEQMLGDVDGNGRVTILDALRVLRAINGKVILSEAEFARADLDGSGTLVAAEALKILKYANGEIGAL